MNFKKFVLIIDPVFRLSSGFLTPWWYCDSCFGVVFTLVFVTWILVGVFVHVRFVLFCNAHVTL